MLSPRVVLALSFLLVAVVAAGVLLTWLGEKNMNYVDGGMFAFAGMIAMIISITKTPRSFVFALVGIVLLATGIMRMINPSFMQKEKLNTNIGTTALVGTLSIGLLTTALGGIVAERQRERAAGQALQIQQARDEAEQRLVRAAEQAREEAEEEEQRLARAAQQAREEEQRRLRAAQQAREEEERQRVRAAQQAREEEERQRVRAAQQAREEGYDSDEYNETGMGMIIGDGDDDIRTNINLNQMLGIDNLENEIRKLQDYPRNHEYLKKQLVKLYKLVYYMSLHVVDDRDDLRKLLNIANDVEFQAFRTRTTTERNAERIQNDAFSVLFVAFVHKLTSFDLLLYVSNITTQQHSLGFLGELHKRQFNNLEGKYEEGSVTFDDTTLRQAKELLDDVLSKVQLTDDYVKTFLADPTLNVEDIFSGSNEEYTRRYVPQYDARQMSRMVQRATDFSDLRNLRSMNAERRRNMMRTKQGVR
jgi:hypothetical protein